MVYNRRLNYIKKLIGQFNRIILKHNECILLVNVLHVKYIRSSGVGLIIATVVCVNCTVVSRCVNSILLTSSYVYLYVL